MFNVCSVPSSPSFWQQSVACGGNIVHERIVQIMAVAFACLAIGYWLGRRHCAATHTCLPLHLKKTEISQIPETSVEAPQSKQPTDLSTFQPVAFSPLPLQESPKLEEVAKTMQVASAITPEPVKNNMGPSEGETATALRKTTSAILTRPSRSVSFAFLPPSSGQSTSQPALPRQVHVKAPSAKEVYKQTRGECSVRHKTALSLEIKTLENIKALMGYCSDSSPLDLRHPICATLAADMILYGSENLVDELVRWLMKEASFEAPLCRACMEAFVNKSKDGKPISQYNLYTLLQKYTSKGWQGKEASLGVAALAMATLIQLNPSADITVALAAKMMDQEGYRMETLSAWLRVLQEKESAYALQQNKTAEQLNLYYPLAVNEMAPRFCQKTWGMDAEEVIHLEKVEEDVRQYLRRQIVAHYMKEKKSIPYFADEAITA